MLTLSICILDGVATARLISKVIEEAMADVNALKYSLEVSDVVQKSAVEELNHKLEEAENLLLMGAQTHSTRLLVCCKKSRILGLYVT